jgi:hypothetical protein
MPIRDAERVVRLSARHPQAFYWFNRFGFEVWPEFAQSRIFDSVGAYVTGELNLAGSMGGRLATRLIPFKL